MTNNKILGNQGEGLAVKYLKKHRYKILFTQYRCRVGEVDIVAQTKDKTYVFVEVKTRSVQHEGSSLYGSPARAVDSKKRTDTVKAAIGYLKTHYTDKQPRIDVIEVYMKERDVEKSVSPQVLRINHIRNAFDAKGRKH